MKKLVLLFAVAMSASLFSCGNAEKAEEATVDTAATEAVVEEVAAVEVDSIAPDSADVTVAEGVVEAAPVAE